MKQNQLLYLIGGSITLIGALTELFEFSFAPYLFSAGALLMISHHFSIAWNNKDAEMRTQRLSRSQFISSLLLALAGYFMFTDSNYWVLCVLIYALGSFFLTYRGD